METSISNNATVADRRHNKWLNRFAWFTAFATLVLICSGGMVTSKGVGLAVPDWPTTFGYNMFLFPVSKWIGGVLFEHTHRLIASTVGILTIVLAIWLWRIEDRQLVKTLGLLAVAGVILQGILGGLRVTMLKDQIGIFHACLAQAFFGLIVLIAITTTNFWKTFPRNLTVSNSQVRIAVCGLNPHAGESGKLGREEIDIIAPAISDLNSQLSTISSQRVAFSGPHSPDTVFHRAAEGEFDAVLCMYHDQGLIPLKLHAFHNGVNITLGLPFLRTSPDHGTAFEIAGKGIAKADSMIAAITLSVELAQSKPKQTN